MTRLTKAGRDGDFRVRAVKAQYLRGYLISPFPVGGNRSVFPDRTVPKCSWLSGTQPVCVQRSPSRRCGEPSGGGGWDRGDSWGELEAGVPALGLWLTAQGRMSVLLFVLVFRGD